MIVGRLFSFFFLFNVEVQSTFGEADKEEKERMKEVGGKRGKGVKGVERRENKSGESERSRRAETGWGREDEMEVGHIP